MTIEYEGRYGPNRLQPIVVVCIYGPATDVDVLRFLILDMGVDAGLKSPSGLTALIVAMGAGAEEAALFLMDMPGCDLDARDEQGHTALFHGILQK